MQYLFVVQYLFVSTVGGNFTDSVSSSLIVELVMFLSFGDSNIGF